MLNKMLALTLTATNLCGCVQQGSTQIKLQKIDAYSSTSFVTALDRSWLKLGPPFFDVSIMVENLDAFSDTWNSINVEASYCSKVGSKKSVDIGTIPSFSRIALLDDRGIVVTKEYFAEHFQSIRSGLFHAWIASRSRFGESTASGYYIPADGEDICLDLATGGYSPKASNILRIPYEKFKLALKSMRPEMTN